jgi:hypothetical protein
MFKQQKVKKQSPISQEVWEQHMQAFAAAPVDLAAPQPAVHQAQPAVRDVQRVADTAWGRAQQNAHFRAEHAVPLGSRRNQVRQAVVPAPVVPPPVRIGEQLVAEWVHDQLEDAAFMKVVVQCVGKMNASSPAGLDEIAVAFIKHAKLQGIQAPGSNVLVPLLSKLFKAMLLKGVIPDDWKVAKISPLYKKGDVCQPSNYRMLAVSTGLYRLYANVLRHILTDWCKKTGAVPDTQFGFYPGRSTTHAMFVLRHAAHAAKKRKLPLYAAFIDFKQAYDFVNRSSLWKVLGDMNMPETVIKGLKSLYDGDSYRLIDGDKCTTDVMAARGVRQGCPLSPLLFSLYIADIKQKFAQSLGAFTGEDHFYVSHVMYADDLVLLTNRPDQLQKMLDILRAFADSKSLTVNVDKSCVMVFHKTDADARNHWRYNGVPLARVEEFKYLGMVFSDKGAMGPAQDHMARAVCLAIRTMRDKAKKLQVHDQPHVMMWLLKAFVIPAAMYGAQVWATGLLGLERCLGSGVQRRILGFCKQVLGVKSTVHGLSALREVGCMPMSHYWMRCTLKFYNSMVNSNSPLLKGVLKADVKLATAGDRSCWTHQVVSACQGVQGLQDTVQRIKDCTVVDWSVCVDRYVQYYTMHLRTLGAGDPRDAEVEHRKCVTYHQWFDDADRVGMCSYLGLPNISVQKKHKMARFRLSSHRLAVETGRFTRAAYGDRVCLCCVGDPVEDEYHAIFECCRFEEIREQFTDIFRDFEHEWQGDAMELQTIYKLDMQQFFKQNPVRVTGFVSRVMTVYDCVYHSRGEQPVPG